MDRSNERPRAGRIVVLFAAVALLGAWVLYFEFHDGAFAGLLPWDDCEVIRRGLQNLQILSGSHTPAGWLRIFPSLRIHAPLSDFQAMLGLLASGGAYWGPFVLNIVLVALVVYVVCVECIGRDDVLAAAIAVAVLLEPLAINSLIFVKSDWKVGLLVGGAIFALYQSVERRSVRLRYWGAGLLSLGILGKLTAFYLPFLAIGIMAVFECYRVVAERAADPQRGPLGADLVGRLRPRQWAGPAALAALPFMLLFAISFSSLIGYIRKFTAGYWDDHLSLVRRAWYYSPGSPEGAVAWGHAHIAFAALAGCALVFAGSARRGRYLLSLAALVLVGLGFALPVVVVHTSNITFGAGIIGVALGGTLIAMTVLAEAAPRLGSWGSLLIACAVSARVQLPLSTTAYLVGPQPTADQLRAYPAAFDGIAHSIEETGAVKPRVLFFFEDLFAPSPDLDLVYFHDTGRFPWTSRVDAMSDSLVFGPQLDSVDVALTFRKGPLVPELGPAAGLYTQIPIGLQADAADAYLARRSDFTLAGSYPVPGGEIEVYRSQHAAANRR